MKKTFLVLTILLLAGFGSAQAAHPPSLVEAAHALDEAARWLEDFFDRRGHQRHRWGHDHREHAADNFARKARHFHRDVERGRSLRHLFREFAELEADFFDLRSQVGYGHGYGRRHPRYRDPLDIVENRLADVKRSLYAVNRRHGRHDRHYRYGG